MSMRHGVVFDSGAGGCHFCQLLPGKVKVAGPDIGRGDEDRKRPTALFQSWISLCIDADEGIIEGNSDFFPGD